MGPAYVGENGSTPQHIDLVQTTAYHQSGAGGSFENYNIERKAIDVDEKIVKPIEISNGYDLFSSTYYKKF